MIDYLNTGAKPELVASRDCGSFKAKIRTRTPQFLLSNPRQTLQGMEVGPSVIAIAGEPEDFKGIFGRRSRAFFSQCL